MTPAEPAPSAPLAARYWCFISYRHSDNHESGREWATWLHHAIETYEVPHDLVGTPNDRGEPIPEHLFPCFRDEEELAAGGELAERIYRALDASNFLAVICSPRVAGSTYVNEEIRYFKKIGGGERVVAVMVEGEPEVSRDPAKRALGIRAEEECFPEVLSRRVNPEGQILDEGAAPLAADFRLVDREQGWTSPEAYRQALLTADILKEREIDRRVEEYRSLSQLALLKILAGILGVPLRRLTKRDQVFQLAQARRHSQIARRIAASFAVLALLALAGAIFAFVQYRAAGGSMREAFAATARAIHARNKAEKLVDFMVFDLREMLEPVGRLDLMDQVIRAEKDYYRDLGPEEEGPEIRRRHAVAMTNEGNVLAGQGAPCGGDREIPGSARPATADRGDSA